MNLSIVLARGCSGKGPRGNFVNPSVGKHVTWRTTHPLHAYHQHCFRVTQCFPEFPWYGTGGGGIAPPLCRQGVPLIVASLWVLFGRNRHQTRGTGRVCVSTTDGLAVRRSSKLCIFLEFGAARHRSPNHVERIVRTVQFVI